MNRNQTIIKAGIINILANILLAGFKLSIGLVSGSAAIMTDAVNNIGDGLKSVIIILSAKLSGRMPDRKHPLGYGRVEYLSSLVIGLIVFYAGLTSLRSSVDSILHPAEVIYSRITLFVLAAAVGVKLLLGAYVKRTGKEISSASLVSSGQEAQMDAMVSFSVLLAAGVRIFFDISLESYLAAIIALLIIKSGFETLREVLSKILGERADGELTKKIKKVICETEGVAGAYDLVLHDYGPDSYTGSVHVELADYFTADQIDKLTRQIKMKIQESFHITIEAVGIYAVNTQNEEISRMREKIRAYACSRNYVLQMHGFYVDLEKKEIRFDLLLDYKVPDRERVYADMMDYLRVNFPEYDAEIAFDMDITD